MVLGWGGVVWIGAAQPRVKVELTKLAAEIM
jgi:hypothetical protein